MDRGNGLFTISGVSRLTGLTEHAIRVWEQRYQAVQPQRTSGNHRRYTHDDVRRLQLLRTAQLSGRSIAEVASLDNEALSAELAPDENAGRSQLAATVDACNRAVDDLDAWALTETLNDAIIRHGYAAVVEGVVGQVMRRVGTRWQSADCGPEHEHLASATFRTFLGSALTSQNRRGPEFTLVAGTLAGEHHELGTLAAAVVAAIGGWRVAYLGPDLPVDSIAHVADRHAALAIVVGVAHVMDSEALHRDIRSLHNHSQPSTTLICGGAGAQLHANWLESNGAQIISTVSELLPVLDSVKQKGARA
jgi:DNA-binding transcriptional MerR regulator